MTLQNASRLLGLLVVTALCAAPAAAQRAAQDDTVVACPDPQRRRIAVQTIDPTSPDFTVLPYTHVPIDILDTREDDRYFRHRFDTGVPGRTCCQALAATLRVTVRSTEPATFSNTPDANGVAARLGDAGNDTFAVYSNGQIIPGNGEGYIWPTEVAVGATRTITVQLNAAALAHMNATGRLSIQVQDDSAVVAAMVSVSYCCLQEPPTIR